MSPKGLPSSSFSVLGPNLVAYIDATGSGCETIAHIYENGRVTIMFNSFDPSPRIMRLFCNGRVVEHDQPEFNDLLTRMGPDKKIEGARAIILLDVWKVCSVLPGRYGKVVNCQLFLRFKHHVDMVFLFLR